MNRQCGIYSFFLLFFFLHAPGTILGIAALGLMLLAAILAALWFSEAALAIEFGLPFCEGKWLLAILTNEGFFILRRTLPRS